MPQPINAIVRDPHIILDPAALADKPDLALIVCEIFATWAAIERDINGILVHMIGANAAPAHAIFSILQAQHLQLKALEAAAKDTLADEYVVFRAYRTVIESVQKTRNKLAHWSWGRCAQRPEFLILADPEMLKKRDYRSAAYFQSADPTKFDAIEVWNAIMFDDSYIYAFTKSDLERDLRDLRQASDLSNLFATFLDPSIGAALPALFDRPMTLQELRAETLTKMMTLPLFMEAMNRVSRNKG
jgi:hypothetical protein